MKKTGRLYLSALLSLFIVSACSAGSPTTPNKANLSTLAKAPVSNPENEVKKVNISGKVIDSVTRKPIENATVHVLVISNDGVLKSVKEGTSVPSPSSSPVTGASAASENSTTQAPVQPIGSPSVSSDPVLNNPTPFIEENEEKTVSPVKSALPKPKTTPTPLKVPSGSASKLEKAPESAVKPSPSASPSIKAEKPDLLNSLSTLKSNDIQEFNTTTGNDGKFWINKVPDSSLIITISAENYKSVSVFNSDIISNSKSEDFALEPLSMDKHLTDIKGYVISATDKPIENADVGVSYDVNNFYTLPSNSGKAGDFEINEVMTGERTFIASTKDEAGKIIFMGLLDFDVKKSEKKKVEKADSKTEEKTDEEVKKKEEVNIEDLKTKKLKPVIKLKSVTEYLKFEGTCEKSENISLKSINVYVSFKKKGQPKEEVFLTEQFIEPSKEESKTERFSLSLPKLEDGYYYHLEFISENNTGGYMYHHEYNLKKDKQDFDIKFVPVISEGNFDFFTREEENIPVFAWTAVKDASYYKVSINKKGKDDKVTTIWTGITPFTSAVYPVSEGNSKNKNSNTYTWFVSAFKDTTSKTSDDKISNAKLNSSNLNSFSVSNEMKFSFESTDTEEIIEIDTEKKEEKN